MDGRKAKGKMKNLIKKILVRYVVVIGVMALVIPLASFLVNGWWDAGNRRLLEYAVIALVCSLGEFIIMDMEKDSSKKKFIIRQLLHYVYINVVVIFFGKKLGYFKFETKLELIVLLGLIALIYFLNTLYSCYCDKKLADQMNEQLKKYHSEKSGDGF